MARRKKNENIEDDAPGLDISSLIDVCFLLLIYFIVTTTIQPREQDLQMSLPASMPSGEPPALAPFFIRVKQDGQIGVRSGSHDDVVETNTDNRLLSELISQLKAYLITANAAGQTPMVQIWAHGEAKEQRVVDVLNALSTVNISNVTFTNLIDNP